MAMPRGALNLAAVPTPSVDPAVLPATSCDDDQASAPEGVALGDVLAVIDDERITEGDTDRETGDFVSDAVADTEVVKDGETVALGDTDGDIEFEFTQTRRMAALLESATYSQLPVRSTAT